MAKAGVESLTRSLALELAKDRINVNNVAPGLIERPITQERLDNPGKAAQAFEHVPGHRAGQPDEGGGLTMSWGGA